MAQGKPLKIAQVVSTFPPYHGGMGYVCFHNALELARLGHEVTVFTLDYGRLSYDGDPEIFRIVRLKPPFVYGDGGFVPGLYPALKGFDVVHHHFPFYGGDEYVYFSSLLRGQRYFLTYHMDVIGTTFLKRMVIGAYDRLLMKRIIRRASLVGALSMQHIGNSKAARFLDWEKVVEIPNGVDCERFRPGPKEPELLKRYGLQGKVVVLFVGNLLYFKGLHVLIDAISRIKDDRVALLVVGGGYEESAYKRQVREGGLEDRVIFAGPKSPDEIPRYYDLSDFLVLPSLYSESFGLVVLEAMASGKPAIVSALPGPSQLVEDGNDGVIVNVGDAEDLREKIELVAFDEDRRREMGNSARRKVTERYDWKIIGKRLEGYLYQIAGPSGAQGG